MFVILVFMGLSLACVSVQKSTKTTKKTYDFGDYKSSTLTAKAWEALGKGDSQGVLAYTDQCIKLYAEEAKKQQAQLSQFALPDKAFKYWALNDVGTCYFIRAEIFMKNKKKQEAINAYSTLADEYSYAQCWDTKGWFWHPAEVAESKLSELE